MSRTRKLSLESEEGKRKKKKINEGRRCFFFFLQQLAENLPTGDLNQYLKKEDKKTPIP